MVRRLGRCFWPEYAELILMKTEQLGSFKVLEIIESSKDKQVQFWYKCRLGDKFGYRRLRMDMEGKRIRGKKDNIQILIS